MDDRFALALGLLDEIRRIVDSRPPGTDAAAERTIRAAVSRLGIRDSYVQTKAAKVARLASRYFSPRKWAGNDQGAEGVRLDIVVNLRLVKEQILTLAKRAVENGDG